MVRVLVVLLVIGSLPVLADTDRKPPMKAATPVSIQGYGLQNPACKEWTDGCTLCAQKDGVTVCSTPGIACTPAGLTCKAMKR